MIREIWRECEMEFDYYCPKLVEELGIVEARNSFVSNVPQIAAQIQKAKLKPP